MLSSVFMKEARSWAREQKNRDLKVYTAAEAAKKADIIMILINDEKQADCTKKAIEPNLEARKYVNVRSWFQYSLRMHHTSKRCGCYYDRT